MQPQTPAQHPLQTQQQPQAEPRPKAQPALDYSALTAPISFQDYMKSSYAKWTIGTALIGAPLFIACFILIAFKPSLGMTLGIIGGFSLLISLGLYYSTLQTMRRTRFAAQNGLTYISNMPYDNRPGIIFREGHSRTFTDIFTAAQQSFTEVGNYRYSVGSGKNEQTFYYGFICITLPRKLPNMVLDSKKNDGLFGSSNLPTGFSADQKLELEGDFNNYFTLYAPAQYKTDALYVFTPDVMQALVDAAKNYDCEIIDDKLYIYSNSSFSFSQKDFEEILKISSLLKKEVSEQVDYYADARVGSRALNEIAPQGQRLKRKAPIATIILAILMFIYFIVTILS